MEKDTRVKTTHWYKSKTFHHQWQFNAGSCIFCDSDCKVGIASRTLVIPLALFSVGHEGDPCLRSSDCIDGFCCARHFWTKICKPVLHQGEVCTKQRKKGSHGLEIFQRCDCAKGLSCKVWKDATYSSKARLHVCQKI